MNSIDRKKHWENIFHSKDTSQVSWHQQKPTTSLQLIEELHLPKTANIIEVGSGDSLLGDCLINQGYSKITLLDISAKALETIRNRLQDKTDGITFCTADITEFRSNEKYDIWHDRAVFHFIMSEKNINKYIKSAALHLKKDGFLIIGTFSTNGPDMCSGLHIQQYSEKELFNLFKADFKKVKCFTENHNTPSGSVQNFQFCVFQRK